MSEFNFNSAICTSKSQSERLLALGLRKETADMYLQSVLNDVWSPFVPIAFSYSDRPEEIIAADVVNAIPAWSLHRLINLCENIACDWIFRNGDCYTNAINCIEWLIKEGYFNKEYLV